MFKTVETGLLCRKKNSNVNTTMGKITFGWVLNVVIWNSRVKSHAENWPMQSEKLTCVNLLSFVRHFLAIIAKCRLHQHSLLGSRSRRALEHLKNTGSLRNCTKNPIQACLHWVRIPHWNNKSKERHKRQRHSTYLAPQATYGSCNGAVHYSLGRSPSPRSRTLARSNTYF